MTTLDHQLNRLSKGDYPVSPNFTIHLVPNDQLYLSVTLSRGRLDTNSRSGFAEFLERSREYMKRLGKSWERGHKEMGQGLVHPTLANPREKLIDTPWKMQDIQNKVHALLAMVSVGDDSSLSVTFVQPTVHQSEHICGISTTVNNPRSTCRHRLRLKYQKHRMTKCVSVSSLQSKPR